MSNPHTNERKIIPSSSLLTGRTTTTGGEKRIPLVNNNRNRTQKTCICQSSVLSPSLPRSKNTVLCSKCCHRALIDRIKENQKAYHKWFEKREYCSQRFQQLHNPNNNTNNTNISELEYESQTLRTYLRTLKTKCSNLAIEVTTLSLKNEDHQQQQQQLQQQQQQVSNHEYYQNEEHSTMTTTTTTVHRNYLYRLEKSIIDGSMKYTIQYNKQQIRILRFQWALQAFTMYKLDIGQELLQDILHDEIEDEQQQPTKRRQRQRRVPRGISKIGGLPLPNAGPELYSVLPPLELQSVLRLISSLTNIVSRCLGILLPHPILLQPPPGITTIASTSSITCNTTDIVFHAQQQQQQPKKQPQQQPQQASNKTTPSSLLSSLVDFSSSWVSAAATAATNTNKKQHIAPNPYHSNTNNYPAQQQHQQQQHNNNNNGLLPLQQATLLLDQETKNTTIIPPSMDPTLVSLRIKHAKAGIMAEKNYEETSSSVNNYSLSVPNNNKQNNDYYNADNNNNNNNSNNNNNNNNNGNTTNNHNNSNNNNNNNNNDNDNNNENFAIALQLLQNNVVALCIRSGVPVSKLWPAEALLLNLYALQVFCQKQTNHTSATTTTANQ